MQEISMYMDSVAAARSLLVDQDTALRGHATLSLETQQDILPGVHDIPTYIEDHFPTFLRNLRFLDKEDQEILLLYYVAGKSQDQIAALCGTTQTLVSQRIRHAVEHLGMLIMMDGRPKVSALREMFTQIGMEHALARPLSIVVEIYSTTRSFQRVAEVLRLHRPAIRRTMSRATKLLKASPDPKLKALGAYMFHLTDKADPTGVGVTQRERAKQGHIHIRDTPLLGQFRVPVDDPGFRQVFAPMGEAWPGQVGRESTAND